MLDNLDNKSGNRRDFLKKTGKQALWMAPTLTVLMTASSQPAQAGNKGSGGGGHTYNHHQKVKTILQKLINFWKSKNR